MNKQEIEKAIELLTHCRKELECYLMCDNEIEVAIDALEKQIPKKPIRHQPTYNFISCPVCNTDLIHTKNYCTYCGQAVDWGNKDE